MSTNIQNNIDVVERIRLALKTTVAELTFTKLNGDTRVIKQATLMPFHLPEDQRPKADAEFVELTLKGTFTFYSIGEGWRSCIVNRVVSMSDEHGSLSPNFPTE